MFYYLISLFFINQ